MTESGSAGCSYEVDGAVLPEVRCVGVLDSGTVSGAGNGRELVNSSAVVKVPFACVLSAGVLLLRQVKTGQRSRQGRGQDRASKLLEGQRV